MVHQLTVQIPRSTWSTHKQLEAVFNKIDALQEFEEDWEEEGTLPVTNDTAAAAKRLLTGLANQMNQQGLTWVEPSLSPDPRGRLHLLWQTDLRRTLLIVAPQDDYIGKSVRTENSGQPDMQNVSQDTAINHVVWTLDIS